MNHQTREECEELFYKWKSIMSLTKSYGPFKMTEKNATVLAKMLQEFFCKHQVPFSHTQQSCSNVMLPWGEFIVKHQIKLYSTESMQKFSELVMLNCPHE